MTFEEADSRLVAGWHVELPEADALTSAQRKRYLRLERERLLKSVVIPTDPITQITAAEALQKSAAPLYKAVG